MKRRYRIGLDQWAQYYIQYTKDGGLSWQTVYLPERPGGEPIVHTFWTEKDAEDFIHNTLIPEEKRVQKAQKRSKDYGWKYIN